MALKLHYFDAPGRAEATRLILTIGGIPFEDKRYKTYDEAKEGMAKGTYGQVPVLEFLDSGKFLSQSLVIERYCAKLANLLPEGDDLAVAIADSLVAFMEDFSSILATTMSIKDLDEKIKARQELLSGKLKNAFTILASLIDKFDNGFACGGKLSYVDIAIFVKMGVFSSGTVDGFPTTVLDEYPSIQKYRHRIASMPAMKKYYKDVTEGGRLAMKPEAVAAFA